MDLLQGMRAFVAVNEAGSFVRAADTLDISKSAVTDHIADLERRLGVRLLQRTTRRLSLTDDGAAYLEHCRRVIADVDETIASLSRGRTVPRGRLHVDCTVTLGLQYLTPVLPRFVEQYPELEVVLTLNDQVIDLLAEGIDVAIRVGNLPDASFVARRLAESRYVIAASPLYIERFGEPAAPDALTAHHCLPVYWASAGRISPWIFETAGVRREWQPPTRLAVSNPYALIAAAAAGLGIVYLPETILERELVSGRLVPILAAHTRTDRSAISAIYPHNRHLSAKVRAFVEFAAGLFPRPRSGRAPSGSAG